MTDVEMQRLKAIELDMLKAFIAVCEKHDLTYFLIGGTALGAVRHGGFIPWDDDIDVGLPRKDYEKFMAVAQADLPEGLFLQNEKTDPEYMTCFAKIRNSNTTFLESTARNLNINHGVFIDIFPLDGCDNFEETAKKTKLLKVRMSAKFLTKRSAKGHLIRLLAIIRYPSIKKARKKLFDIWRKLPYELADDIANFSGVWGKKEVMPKQVYGAGTKGTFEGLSVTLPANPDEYLTRLYGDYMTPPPPEKRVSHHYCDVIDLDTSYTTYVKK